MKLGEVVKERGWQVTWQVTQVTVGLGPQVP